MSVWISERYRNAFCRYFVRNDAFSSASVFLLLRIPNSKTQNLFCRQSKERERAIMVFPQPNSDKPLQQAFSHLRTSCNGFFRDLQSSLHSNFPFSSLFQNPNVDHLSAGFQSAFSNIQHLALKAIPPPSSARSPAWARIPSPGDSQTAPVSKSSGKAVVDDDVEERLSGVLVYALCNSNEDFVLISSPRSKGSMSLLFFTEEDADSLLQQMRTIDPRTSAGTKVVAVPLNKVYKLKADGVAFRFIPQRSQIKNAVQEMQRAGYKGSFSGVPVFQSESLVLKGQKKTYRPVFFRKEDLEDILRKAYGVPGSLSPMPKQVDIQVGVFEDIVSVMKDTNSVWDDVVFVPPGFDIGSDSSRIQQATFS
ncbi:hypothetical protein V2J09_018462 [Rumex salicifolius]